MNAELKKVKVVKKLSEETTCFTAELWIDGVFAAEVSNRGQGGPDEMRFEDRNVEARFDNHIKSLANHKSPFGPMEMNAELFIARLMDAWEEKEFLKKHCKTKTLFLLIDDMPGAYRTVKAPFSPAVKEFLQKKYGPKLFRIMNEEVK